MALFKKAAPNCTSVSILLRNFTPAHSANRLSRFIYLRREYAANLWKMGADLLVRYLCANEDREQFVIKETNQL